MKKATAIIAILSMLMLCSCGARVKPTVTSKDDIPGKKIGVLENSISQDLAASEYPDSQIEQYQSTGVMANDLALGVIDCIIADSILRDDFRSQSDLKILDEPISRHSISLVCARERSDLCGVLSSALESMESDGTISKIISGNVSGNAPVISPDSTVRKNTLKIAVTLSGKPYAYYENSILMGFEIDIIRELCRRSDLGVEFSVMQGDSAVSYVVAGKADVAAGCLFDSGDSSSLTVFSTPYYISEQVIITRK